MYIAFFKKINGNERITMSNKAFFNVVTSFNIKQFGVRSYQLQERRQGKRTYQNIKNILRDFAIDWQQSFSRFNYDWFEIGQYQEFFNVYGKKYGLIKEFTENGIL